MYIRFDWQIIFIFDEESLKLSKKLLFYVHYPFFVMYSVFYDTLCVFCWFLYILFSKLRLLHYCGFGGVCSLHRESSPNGSSKEAEQRMFPMIQITSSTQIARQLAIIWTTASTIQPWERSTPCR